MTKNRFFGVENPVLPGFSVSAKNQVGNPNRMSMLYYRSMFLVSWGQFLWYWV